MELGGNLNARGNAELMDASSTYAWPIAGRARGPVLGARAAEAWCLLILYTLTRRSLPRPGV
jgi:hypothetical protein